MIFGFTIKRKIKLNYSSHNINKCKNIFIKSKNNDFIRKYAFLTFNIM